MVDLPRYYLVGSWRRPVKIMPTPDGGMTILAYDWARGEFKRAMIYANTLFASSDDYERIAQDVFEQKVTENRGSLSAEDADARETRRHAIQSSPYYADMDERMRERLEEYDWQPDRILNFISDSVLYDRLDKVYNALKMMNDDPERYPIVRFLDRFANPLDDGYRDILMNLVMPNDHIAEVRLEIESIHQFSLADAAPIYAEIRAINAPVIAAQRDFSAEETARIGLLQALLRARYEALILRAKT